MCTLCVMASQKIRRSRSRASLCRTDLLCDIKIEDRKPHYSQLHCGRFELLSVDDDPINQVSVRASNHFFSTDSDSISE
jgi:hypothetical protein